MLRARLLDLDLPRTLAAWVIGGGDVLIGVAGLLSHPARTPDIALVPPPLIGANIVWIVIGVALIAGARRIILAWVTSILAVIVWAVWTRFVIEALMVGIPDVNLRSVCVPMVITAVHLLLTPYARKPRR